MIADTSDENDTPGSQLSSRDQGEGAGGVITQGWGLDLQWQLSSTEVEEFKTYKRGDGQAAQFLSSKFIQRRMEQCIDDYATRMEMMKREKRDVSLRQQRLKEEERRKKS
jgi:hypothetical protein